MNRESAWFNKNTKRFLTGGIVIFLVFQICDSIIHGPLLGHYYESVSVILRPDAVELMWILYPGRLILSFLIIFIFIKGYEDRGIMEGVRFGLMMGIVTYGMGSLYQYVFFPLPIPMILRWFCYGLIEFILIGVAAAIIYKPVPEEDKEKEEDEDDMEIVG